MLDLNPVLPDGVKRTDLDLKLNLRPFVFILSEAIGALDEILILRNADKRNAQDAFITAIESDRTLK